MAKGRSEGRDEATSRSASEPIVSDSNPQVLACSTAAARIAARVSSPFVEGLAVAVAADMRRIIERPFVKVNAPGDEAYGLPGLPLISL